MSLLDKLEKFKTENYQIQSILCQLSNLREPQSTSQTKLYNMREQYTEFKAFEYIIKSSIGIVTESKTDEDFNKKYSNYLVKKREFEKLAKRMKKTFLCFDQFNWPADQVF